MISTLLLLTIISAEPYTPPRYDRPAPPVRADVWDSKGNRAGWIREDPFVKGRLNVYDRDYKKKYTIQDGRKGD